MNYRSDIDGLRAIAVTAVVLFHLNPDFFASGYLGVDVFKVRSSFDGAFIYADFNHLNDTGAQRAFREDIQPLLRLKN